MPDLVTTTARFKQVTLPAIADASGVLGVASVNSEVPFPPSRAFFITKLRAGARRGGHAHRLCQQFFICLHGGIDVEVDDGRCSDEFRLQDPGSGLYVPPMTWLDYAAMTDESICLVLASDAYDEADYIRDRAEFQSSHSAREWGQSR